MKNFGKRFKKIRQDLRHNQKEFGELFNLSGDTISAIEREKSFPTFQMLEKLATMGINCHWIISGDGSMYSDNVGKYKNENNNLYEIVSLLENYGSKKLFEDIKTKLLDIKRIHDEDYQ